MLFRSPTETAALPTTLDLPTLKKPEKPKTPGKVATTAVTVATAPIKAAKAAITSPVKIAKKIIGKGLSDEQQKNMMLLQKTALQEGMTQDQANALTAIAGGESQFKPGSEGGERGEKFSKTSNTAIRGMTLLFKKKLSGLSEEELTQLKKDPKALLDKVYGGELGNAPNEGFKYRGRGFIQLTGKSNYEKYGKIIGVDLVNNPELANNPEIAAKIAVAYSKDRVTKTEKQQEGQQYFETLYKKIAGASIQKQVEAGGNVAAVAKRKQEYY